MMKKNLLFFTLLLLTNHVFAQFGGGFAPFDEVPKFERGNAVLSFGIGLKSDVQFTEYDTKLLLPALSLSFEKPIAKNIGLGLILGAQINKIPVFNYQYRYYTGGLRATYHFNFLEQLDTYIGATGTFRYMEITNTERREYKTKITPSWLIGARYYFKERMGAFVEVGNDAMTHYKLGLCFLFL